MIGFRYDINVDIEDIKSPLPSRETNSQPIEEEKPVNEHVETRSFEQPTPPAAPVMTVETEGGIKKLLKNKLVLFGGIGFLVILILILVFASLGNKTKKDEKVTINYWGLWEDEAIINSAIASFEAKNPNIKVNYKRNQLVNYRSRLWERLRKTGNEEVETVDVFRIHNTWVPMFREYLAKVPNNVVKDVGLETDFFDVYKTDLKENGSYLSIPLMYDGLALFYNKDLVKDTSKLPKTWWDLEDIAKELTTKDENDVIKVSGAALGNASNVDHWSDIVGLMMKQNGIDLIKGTNQEIDQSYKNLEDVLNFYTSFITKDKVWDESMASSTQAFASGKLAFYIGPSWRAFDIKILNKDLNFGITTVPQLPVSNENGKTATDSAQLTNIHWATYWTEGVNNLSSHQTEAWKFLEYLSSVDGLSTMYLAQSQIRDFGEIYPRKSMVNKLADNEKVQPFISTANNATNWYLASNTNDGGLNTDMQKYFGDAINSILKKEKSEETMSNFRKGIVQTQNKYSLKR